MVDLRQGYVRFFEDTGKRIHTRLTALDVLVLNQYVTRAYLVNWLLAEKDTDMISALRTHLEAYHPET